MAQIREATYLFDSENYPGALSLFKEAFGKAIANLDNENPDHDPVYQDLLQQLQCNDSDQVKLGWIFIELSKVEAFKQPMMFLRNKNMSARGIQSLKAGMEEQKEESEERANIEAQVKRAQKI